MILHASPVSISSITPWVLGTLLVLTGCASTPPRRFSTTPGVTPEPPPRTELVLLNIPEGSGWVSYRQEKGSQEVEDYRIVVIRQETNELIYDSVIPLSAAMATHGFELARDDPRLENLARNVDRNIILPLEEVIPVSMEMPAGEIPESVPEETAAPETEEPATDPAPPSPPPADPEPAPEPTPEPLAETAPETEDSPAFLFLEQLGERILIAMPIDHPLRPGDRLFVREPDRTIALPGGGEQILVAKGTVTGLITVEEVTGTVAHTTLLSGYLPEDPRFEVSEEE